MPTQDTAITFRRARAIILALCAAGLVSVLIIALVTDEKIRAAVMLCWIPIAAGGIAVGLSGIIDGLTGVGRPRGS